MFFLASTLNQSIVNLLKKQVLIECETVDGEKWKLPLKRLNFNKEVGFFLYFLNKKR